MINRYESIVYSTVKECRACMCFSTEISYKERADYQLRVSNTERTIIKLLQLIKPKIKILRGLAKAFKNDPDIKLYFVSLAGRIKKISGILLKNQATLLTAQNLFRTCAEDTITKSHFKAGELMKFYSGITTIAVPMVVCEGL